MPTVDTTRSTTTRPATGQPDTGRPATGQPDTGQPDTSQPATGQAAGPAGGLDLPAARWPFRSYLAVRAQPAAVGRARLHARQMLGEWHLPELADTVTLLVSELLTNAVLASGRLTADRPMPALADPPPAVWLRLSAGQDKVLIEVWDPSPELPAPRPVDLGADGGRGLLLVEALSRQWGAYVPERLGGKVVCASVAE